VTSAEPRRGAQAWSQDTLASRAGAGLAILVNANARRGGRRVAVQIARALPGASVRLTRTTQEIDAWLRSIPRPRCVLSAGGDGTAVALLNALDRVTPKDEAFPLLGLLPLGTGNGWAHAMGAPKLDRCLHVLEAARDPLPARRYGAFEVEGTLAHFAGSGWDAMILDDYKRQLAASKGPSRFVNKSVYGYLAACLLRTTPKVATFGNPHVLIENLGDDVFTVGPDCKVVRVREAKRGAVIYDGPAGTCSVGTCPEFGYGFKAFPFAERMLGWFNVRVYSRGALGAVVSIPRLWKGAYPIRGMHDWFATAVRMTFSRDVPLQIGGDAHGARRTVEYRMSPRKIEMLDWWRMI
jgi:diacylglycerol kinase family enzyme